jgi:hypothetical protein
MSAASRNQLELARAEFTVSNDILAHAALPVRQR